MKQGTFILLAMTLLNVYCWPSYKRSSDKSKRHSSFEEINTAMVHNNCCDIGKFKNPINVQYPITYSISWNMYHMDNCYDNPNCPQPPYESPEALNYSRKTAGSTFYDFRHRGGSQKEVYNDFCIPIFPSFDPPKFSCDFYLVTQQDKAYMTTKGAPQQFGECCILASPFHPPARNFTTKMKFGGKKSLKGQEYFEYAVTLPDSGPFVHGFWANPTQQRNYAPAIFYMLGIGNKWLYQQFSNFKEEPFNSQQVFAIPKSCRSPNVKPCPDFEDAVKRKTRGFSLTKS